MFLKTLFTLVGIFFLAQPLSVESDLIDNYSDDVRERVVMKYGSRTVQLDDDISFSFPKKMRNKKNCFIVMSKKDYYLYVYEPQGTDTVLLARFDCAFGMKKGDKMKRGDMKTPNSTLKKPFTISQIADASSWRHDFKDGRGNIKSYGRYFLRLVTPGHSGIGIHGSTNNEESVPGRASEGCIRLRDKDIIDLGSNYAFVGMKVVIKDEYMDDFGFERVAQKRLKKSDGIVRLRHIDPAKVLSNEQILQAKTEKSKIVLP